MVCAVVLAASSRLASMELRLREDVFISTSQGGKMNSKRGRVLLVGRSHKGLLISLLRGAHVKRPRPEGRYIEHHWVWIMCISDRR